MIEGLNAHLREQGIEKARELGGRMGFADDICRSLEKDGAVVRAGESGGRH
jgi:hypothetical protein